MIFELCLSSHHQRPWAQRRQWHNNWLALLFGLVSWCAWPHRHPGPRLSFFQGCWFLCTSLSWTVQTNAMYLHSCFQAVECLLVRVAVSLNKICCSPFNISYDCPMTSFTQSFPDASAMFCPLWASGQAHSPPDLERGVKGTFPSQHFCTECSLSQICTGGCFVPQTPLPLPLQRLVM